MKRRTVRKVVISKPTTPQETERVFGVSRRRSRYIQALVDQVISPH